MIKKVRITADAVLAIVRGIFEDEDVNIVIDDPDAPPEWQGKTVSEILNVEYYTFKHRPKSTEEVIKNILESQGQANELTALTRAFGLLSIENIERIYSKDEDTVFLESTLQYYIQSSKIKLLEYLIENSNIDTSGLRIPVQFGSEIRKAVVFFDRPLVGDVQTATPFGEIVNVDIDITIMLYPNVASYSDYTINIGFTEDGKAKNSDVPISSFSVANVMTQDSVPCIPARETVGNINLSRAQSFVLVFEGYEDNDFINYLTDKELRDGGTDNNELFTLNITRCGTTYTYSVIIKDHKIVVNADTNNEVHTLSFVKQGVKHGS